MISRINTKYGIIIERAVLNEEGESERDRLKDLAMQEYEDTGAFSSEKLLEANEDFLSKAMQQVASEDEDTQTECTDDTETLETDDT